MRSDSPLRKVIRSTLRAHLGATLLLLFAVLGAVVTSLLPPLVLGQAVDLLASGRPFRWSLALLYPGLIALAGLLEAGQNVAITVFGQKITHGLRSEMCAKLQRLPAAYFAANEAGKTASRFVGDVDTVDSLFTDGIVGMFADACKVVGVLAVIFAKSPGLGALMLVVTPLLFWLTRAFQKRMLRAQLDNRSAMARLNNHVPETICNIRTVRTLFRQRYMEKKYDGYLQQSFRASERTNLYDSLYSPIVLTIGAAVVAVMMSGAAADGWTRQFFGIGVGTAVAAIAYVGKIFDPIESIGMEIQSIQSAVAGVRRIDEFLREPERPSAAAEGDSEPTGSPQPAGAEERVPDARAVKQPCIRFEHVCFGYGEGEVLDNLSFELSEGETAALTGRTGAGKSTVFKLLLGLYAPQSGQVLVGGRQAAAIPDSAKRALFGYVEQSFRIVDGTVGEQISLFDPAVSGADVAAAAQLVGLDETIRALPQGYDTPASAIAFSQGQLQLLSIARAVAARPQILLLDEINANLDSDTEHRVMDALASACAGRTVLSVSHRLFPGGAAQRTIPIGRQPEGEPET